MAHIGALHTASRLHMESGRGLDVAKEAIEDQVEFRVYRQRWLVLILYVLFCINNAAQWIQYSIIADVITKYYNVDISVVNWTSMVWMVVYIILIFPATWLLNYKGLRFVLILGQAITCAGSWIKVASVSPDLFWVSFLGQSIVATAQVYALSTPAAVAAMWFSAEQVSTATAIGVFGYMIGNALGSLMPPLLVQEGSDEEIEKDLSILFYSFAGFTTVLLILIIIFFKDKPPSPPSAAQANRKNGAGVDVGAETPRQFIAALGRVLLSPNFITLVIAYGIAVGVFSAIMTFLNQMVLEQYPNGQVFAGNIGVTVIVCGLFGAMICGYILDRTHKYKEICLALYALATASSIGFALLLGFKTDQVYIYLVSIVIGFALIGYLPSGYEFAAELTYPEVEATSACVLAISTQVFALVFTLIYGFIIPIHGATIANGIMGGALAVGTLLSIITRSDLRRQQAEYNSISNTN